MNRRAFYTAVTSFDRDVFHLRSVASCRDKLIDLHFVGYNAANRLRMEGSSPHFVLLNNLGNTRILLESQEPTTDLIRTKLDEDGNLLAMHLDAKGMTVWGQYDPKQRYYAVHASTSLETLQKVRDSGEKLVPKTTLDRMLGESIDGTDQICAIKATNQKDVGVAYYAGRVGDNGGVPVSTTYPDLAVQYTNEDAAQEQAAHGGDIAPLLYELYPDLKLSLLRKFFQKPRYIVLLPNGRYMAGLSSGKTTCNLGDATTIGEDTDGVLLDRAVACLRETYQWSGEDHFLYLPVQHEYNRALKLILDADCKPLKPGF